MKQLFWPDVLSILETVGFEDLECEVTLPLVDDNGVRNEGAGDRHVFWAYEGDVQHVTNVGTGDWEECQGDEAEHTDELGFKILEHCEKLSPEDDCIRWVGSSLASFVPPKSWEGQELIVSFQHSGEFLWNDRALEILADSGKASLPWEEMRESLNVMAEKSLADSALRLQVLGSKENADS